ncbi:hypothetical protein ACFL0A_00140 [Patescibacteria group bacterium]
MFNFYQNKKKKKLLLFFLFLGFCLFFLNVSPVKALKAEVDWPELPGGVKIEEGGQISATLPSLIEYLFNFALMIGGLAAFFMLILGGFRYLTSTGNPTATSDAKDRITSAILGLLLLLASYLLLQVINPDILILKPI